MIRLLALAALLVLPVPAAARPPEGPVDPAMSAWFRSLRHPRLGGCCDEADCRRTDYRLGPDGYEALIDERFPGVTSPRWERVPDDAVLTRENPTGSAVACWFGGRIRCFVPQALF